MDKVYMIRRSDGVEYTGTFAELVSKFKPLLMMGNSFNQRIRVQPQDARRLVMHLNMAVRVSQKTKENKYVLVKRKEMKRVVESSS